MMRNRRIGIFLAALAFTAMRAYASDIDLTVNVTGGTPKPDPAGVTQTVRAQISADSDTPSETTESHVTEGPSWSFDITRVQFKAPGADSYADIPVLSAREHLDRDATDTDRSRTLHAEPRAAGYWIITVKASVAYFGNIDTWHGSSTKDVKFTVYEVKSIEVKDGDGRLAKDQLLQVVGTPLSDTIKGTAKFSPDVTPPSGSIYPEWALAPTGDSAEGATYSTTVSALPVPAGTTIMRSVGAAQYFLDCEGQECRIQVHPGDEGKWTLDLEKAWALGSGGPAVFAIAQSIEFGLSLSPAPIQFKSQTPKGTLELTNKWKEQSSTNLAKWTWVFKAGANPLVGVDAVATVGLTAVVPESIRDYIAKADLEVRLGGSLNLNGTASEDENEQFNVNGGLGGEIRLDAKLVAGLADGAIGCDLGGKTQLKGNGIIVHRADEDDIALKYGAQWDPLVLTGSFTFGWGLWSWSDSWKIFDTITVVHDGYVSLYSLN